MPKGSAYPGSPDDLEAYRDLVDRHPGAVVLGAKNPYTSRNGWMTSFLDPDGLICLRRTREEVAHYWRTELTQSAVDLRKSLLAHDPLTLRWSQPSRSEARTPSTLGHSPGGDVMTLANTDDHHGDAGLLGDAEVVARILGCIDNGTTFLGERTWQEPTDHYIDPDRYASELELLSRAPTVFCPSAALGEPGSYLARDSAGVPLLAVRGRDGRARVFRNACRHRGVQVAEGQGCKHAFVCPYHGWSYGTDGELRHVPHEHGFPGLDTATHGLVPVNSIEVGGLLFVSQDDATSPSVPPLPAALVPATHAVLGYSETDIETNWKLFVESFLEGYHIRSTHATTFYPIQFDNLNWIEFFGDHTRVAYPYRSIEKLRDAPLDEGAIDYYLTYVYHFFPNVIVATTPGRVNVIVLEPQSTGSTRMVSFWTGVPDSEPTRSKSGTDKGPDYQSAQAEDIAMVTSAQRGLASGANQVLEFGLFESAIVRFYERLERALAAQ